MDEDEYIAMEEVEAAIAKNGVHLLGPVVCRNCNYRFVAIVPQSRGFEHIECNGCSSKETDLAPELL